MIREHETRLVGKGMVLRPMTEGDWDVLYRWNNDPEVLEVDPILWTAGSRIKVDSLWLICCPFLLVLGVP